MIKIDREIGKREVMGLLRADRLKQAMRLAKSLVTHFPKDPSVRFLSGLVSLSQNNRAIAVKHFSQAIKLGTTDLAAFTNLATLQMSFNAMAQADKTLALAARKFGDDCFEIVHQATTLRIAENRLPEALELANKCIVIDAGRAEGWALKGQILRSMGQLFEAIASCRKAVTLDPFHAQACINLSWLLSITSQTEEALRVTKAAATRMPECGELLSQFALRSVEAGRFDEASSIYQGLVTDPVQGPLAMRMLAQFAPVQTLPPLIDLAGRTVKLTKDPEALGQLHLALHNAHTRAELKRPAKISLGTANAYFARARPYSRDEDAAYHAAIKAAYRPDLLPAVEVREAGAKEAGAKEAGVKEVGVKEVGAPTPIFILGMIRSGTTLLERMLTNHGDVGSLGEVALVGRAIDGALQEGGELGSALTGLARDYQKYQSVAGDVGFTTDKMPNNYLYIGYLRQAFPNCKIILLMRDFRDIAISAFENYFDSPALNFSYSEAGLLNRLGLFHDMICHWRAMGGVHTVWYEDLVAEPNRTLQGVAQYCGLTMQQRMIRPEEAQAPIRTASHSQARKPIYTSSQSRWKDDPVTGYLPSVVSETDNSTIAWRVAWLEEMRRRQKVLA